MKNGNSIHYTYDALGRKRGKSIVTLKSVVDVPMGQLHPALTDEIKSNRKIYYCSNLEYAGLTKIGLYLQHIPDGYVANGECYFQITDHLGNVRAEVGAVHNEANYFPSGIQHNFSYLDKDYAFANKEFQSSHRLNLYDFGERYYEMHLSHWTTMDPLCEKYYWLSPYSYCGGNPVNRIDPTGADWVLISDSDGERYEWRDDVSSQEDLDKVMKGAKYMNKTFTKDGTYYSLFGSKLNAKSLDGQIAQKVDNAIIKQVEYLTTDHNTMGGEDTHSPVTDFYLNINAIDSKFIIPIDTKRNELEISFEGSSQGSYYIYSNKEVMKGNMANWVGDSDMPMHIGGYSSGGKAYHILFRNQKTGGQNKGSDIVHLKYTKQAATSLLNKYYKLFPQLKK